MDKPVRTSNDSNMPVSAKLAIGGLALFGAVSLVVWVISVVAGLVKFAIAVVVILAVISLIAGRWSSRD